jgi:molybdate transport system ATP-binding protein
LITIHPTAIALHREQPSGSPRNTWQTRVASVEPLGDTTRITLGDPLPLGVDITPGATTALDLHEGVVVWASVKATEINVTPAAANARSGRN